MKKNSSISVLQIFPLYDIYNIYYDIVDISNFLVNNGHRAIVLSSYNCAISHLDKRVVRIINKNFSTNRFFYFFYIAKNLYKIITKSNVDVVHTNSISLTIFCKFVLKLFKLKDIRFITTVYLSYINSFILKRFVSAYYFSLNCNKDVIISVSDVVRYDILKNYKINSNKVFTVNRCVNNNYVNKYKIKENCVFSLTSRLKIPEQYKIVLVPIKNYNSKNYIFILNTLKLVKYVDFVCIIVNYGNLEEQSYIEKKVLEFNLSCVIRFISTSDDFNVSCSISSVVLIPLIENDSCNRIIMEFMAMGKIVISTCVGDSESIITHQINGFLTTPGSDKQLAETIDKVLVMPKSDILFIENNAIEYSKKNFTYQKMCSETLKVYSL